MFKQVIVGVDEQQGSRDAIALASRLRAPDGELTLAHVFAGDPHLYRSPTAFYEAQRERALALLQKAREETGVQAQLRWRASPSPGRGLHELCEIVAADLLVMGSSRRGILGRALIGDDTRAALNAAPCAVAIAPAGLASEPAVMREIGVGYDGSPESAHALAVARQLAAELGTKLSAFEAVSFRAPSLDAARSPLSDAVDALVQQARNRITSLGGVEPHAAYGEPAEELAIYSASLDLLVVGSRGYGPLGRLIHGSTSQELARRARCPLLVLARSAPTSEEPEPSEHRAAGAIASNG